MATSKSKGTKAATIEDVLAAISDLSTRFDEFVENSQVEDGDVEDDDEDEEEVELTREMVEEATEAGIKALRELAAEHLEDPPTKKAEILEAFDEILDDEDEEDEEDDEDLEDVEDDDEEDDEEADDEDEDEDESDEWTREELEELDLKEVRKVAREAGYTTDDYKGMDQDAIVDLIMGEADEDDEDDEDEEDEDSEEEVEELDEDALKAMTQKDLIGLAKELEIKVPTKLKTQSAANKKKLVAMILDSGEEEE